MANYLIGQLGMPAPSAQDNVFQVLGQAGLLDQDLARRMMAMVRFRNILVHDYLDIDARIVHSNLTQELADVDQFAKVIATRFLADAATSG